MDELREIIKNTAVKLILNAATELPLDIEEALKNALKLEKEELARKQLELIIKNVEYAKKRGIPICQDTGTVTFYAKVGSNFSLMDELPRILIEGTKKATNLVPLRPNAVNPFTGENTGDNTGVGIPCIHWEIVRGRDLELTVLLKGGGSENTSKLAMLQPSEGIHGIKKAVLEAIIEAGGKPCPPTIVGVGIGGGADVAMELAKKATLRSISIRHPDPKVAKLESEIYELANKTGIGPMGLGGETTVLGVNIEYAYRHPASLPVGIIMQCWATRRASARITNEGEVKFLSHVEEKND